MKKIAFLDKYILGYKEKYEQLPRIYIQQRQFFEEKGKTILNFIERWGMVAAKPGGEDSAGREKLELATPEEVVARAIKMANLAYDYLEKEKLLLRLPDFIEMNAAIDAQEEIKEGWE